MALDKDKFADLVVNNMDFSDAPNKSQTKKEVREFMKKLGDALFQHIQDSAEVTVDSGIATGDGSQTIEEGSGTIS